VREGQMIAIFNSTQDQLAMPTLSQVGSLDSTAMCSE